MNPIDALLQGHSAETVLEWLCQLQRGNTRILEVFQTIRRGTNSPRALAYLWMYMPFNSEEQATAMRSRVPAIKMYRARTGCGLIAAKNILCAYERAVLGATTIPLWSTLAQEDYAATLKEDTLRHMYNAGQNPPDGVGFLVSGGKWLPEPMTMHQLLYRALAPDTSMLWYPRLL